MSYKCHKLVSDANISEFYQLLVPEFISNGGNIRDIDTVALKLITQTGGELWGIEDKGALVSGCSVLPVEGENSLWWYLNHGVTKDEYRKQGIIQILIRELLRKQRYSSNYFVFSVARRAFLENGFNEVTIEELSSIDKKIGDIARSKWRPDNPAHIFIRTN